MQELEQDLRTIGAMQKRFLPEEVPQPPGWNLAVHYQVGRWAGGNYYDFLPLADGRLALVLADASEQGGPAAALVAMLRVFIHSCPLASGRADAAFCPLQGEVVQVPHVLLGNLNQIILENSLHGQTMSLFCGILSPLEGTLHFANAGHPSPRWFHARTRSIEALRYAVGLPLGMDAGTVYHHKRIAIETGDVLVFYTHGVIAGGGGSLARLDRSLKQSARHSAAAIKNAILSACPRNDDDATLLVLQRST